MKFLRKVKKIIELVSVAVGLVSAIITLSKPLISAYKEHKAKNVKKNNK